MKQLRDFSDTRQLGTCVYCGEQGTTRDHVPSRVLLDDPFPENLPVVAACETCNQRFSQDEEYLACLVEVVRTGSTASNPQMRKKVQRILERNTLLAERIQQTSVRYSNTLWWEPELPRVQNIVTKLARGHAAFETGDPMFEVVDEVVIMPLLSMSELERAQFEHVAPSRFWPEVGSRAMQRMIEDWPNGQNGWIEVQPERYRYTVSVDSGVRVRFVLSEYLACRVTWV